MRRVYGAGPAAARLLLIHPVMRSGLSYLLAARQCEIGELERLARTGELVSVIGRFTHALQRERGTSNIFLASGGRRAAALREQQIAQCAALQAEVIGQFDQLDTEASRVPNGARLFSRIAVVLHGLEGLPALRGRIGQLAMTPADATAAYVRLIAHLLAVVFEAADSAGDPEVSRALVAMFNFMQGKEFAGQERAFGGGVFASGRADTASRHHWQQLIELQQGCFQLFLDYSDPAVLAVEHGSQQAEVLAEIERLRRIGCFPSPRHEVDPALTDAWYDACTRRIDGMRIVEDALAQNLRRVCERQIEQAREALRGQQATLDDLLQQEGHVPEKMEARYGPNLERSIVAMVQDQSRRLQAMSDELDNVRAALNDRKVVERAKGLLMAHRQLTEDEAHKVLRTMAMNQNRRLVDVAEALLTMADVLPGRAH
jgi:hypothetical protein